MADAVRMTLAELLRKAEVDPGLDVLREGVRVLAQALMDTQVSAQARADGEHRGASRPVRSAVAAAAANRRRPSAPLLGTPQPAPQRRRRDPRLLGDAPISRAARPPTRSTRPATSTSGPPLPFRARQPAR